MPRVPSLLFPTAPASLLVILVALGATTPADALPRRAATAPVAAERDDLAARRPTTFPSATARVLVPSARVTPLLRPTSPASIDLDTTLDINDLRMFVTNVGAFAYDITTGNAGLEFPRGSGSHAMFAAGLWLGARVNGEKRVTVSEYSYEYGPGPMVGGAPDNPLNPAYRVYKLNRIAPDLNELAAYNAGAVPHGAPPITLLGDGTLDLPGDQMLWSVFNDADPSLHTNGAGSTLPLGVEVRHTTFAFNDPGPLGRTAFLRYEILNRGSNTLQDLYVGLWSDPDLGGAADDLVGSAPALGLGYVYNATNADLIYGTSPPAVGFDLLGPPTLPGGGFAGLASFTFYVNGTDPASALEAYHRMTGHDPGGFDIIDPSTGLRTTFMVPGDPLAGTGWVDTQPSDHRMMLAAGPLTLGPGQSTTVTWALVIGQEDHRLASLARLICDDQVVQAFFNDGLGSPRPVRQPCPAIYPSNCPRTAAFWADQCGPGADFSSTQVVEIAGRVDQATQYFDFGATPAASWCALLAGPTDTPRRQAEHEFAALMSTLAASNPPIVPTSGDPVYLDRLTAIGCVGLEAGSIGELAGMASVGLTARYLDHVATHPVPIAGVNAGLPAFGGGASAAYDFFGSTLNPYTQPDSFPHIELRFDATAPQKAYRYLRFETAGGGFPLNYPGGRGYVYAGLHDVPFACWDIDHGEQLDVAFVERTVVDEWGTILGPEFQVATFDSTWSPAADELGGREYLLVFRRGYGPTPKAELAVDGAFQNGTLPGLYGLWSHRIDPASVFDDGDAFQFDWGIQFGPAVDGMMIRLAAMPAETADPIYTQIASCLGDINRGNGIGPLCQDVPTAVLVSLVSLDATPERVSLVWSASSPVAVRLERRRDAGAWLPLANLSANGAGRITYEDRDIVAGRHYGYRLQVMDEGVERVVGETSVQIPLVMPLALSGFVRSAGHAPMAIAFSLPERAPARLAIYDVAGRRVHALQVGSLGPGRHLVTLEGRALPSGVYLLRLEQGGRAVTARSAMVR